MWFARRKRKAEHRILVGKPEGKKPLGRPRRRCENKSDGRACTRLTASEQGQMLGCCEHGNEPLCSVKCGEFLDHLRSS